MGAKSLAEKFLKKVPQYTRSRRHVDSVIHHGTLRKWKNLFRVEVERKLRRVRVKGYPYILFIDPCNFCNLRCPLCPTGVNDLGRPQAMLSFEHFRRYFDPLAPYLFEANLHNWGESLLNPEVYRMIAHVQSRNVGSNLSSNFVKLTSEDLDNILESGLEYLTISLDGTDQESYEQYRVRGDYEVVIENVSELLRRRTQRGLKRPFVEWQYIVMRHNEHQIPEAEKISKKLGVDLLRFIPVGLPYDAPNRQELAEKWYPTSVQGRTESDGTEQQFAQKGKPGPCFYLYRSMVVNPDGGVSPCCIVPREHTDFANLSEMEEVDVLDVYNNENYRSGRALFGKKKSVGHVRTTCDGCDIFARPAANPVTVSPKSPAADSVSGFVAISDVGLSADEQEVDSKN